jgi:hypothetical protein
MKNKKGYIAITSILVILAVVLTVGTTVSLLSVNNIQASLTDQKGEEALALVEGCAEDALLRLNNNNSIPGSISLPEGNCNITNISNVGNDWTFTVSATILSYTKSLQINATRTNTVQVTSWLEI